MNFYPHHLGDYAKDTKNLTPLEHGCYRLLMDHNYATEKPVPNDVKELYRIVGAATPAERKAVDKVVERFFPINGDGRRHHKRIEAEIAKANEKAVKAKASADARWGANRSHEPPDMRTHSGGNASQEPIAKESTAKGANAPSSEPSVPDCPHEEILALYAKHLPMLTQPRLWEGRRAELLRVRWRGCAKRNEVWPGYSTVEAGLAFWDQFFADVAKCKPLAQGIARGDGSFWKADLPWLLKAENFAKVIEGKYLR